MTSKKRTRTKWTNETFIARANEVHKSRYAYSETIYHGINCKLTVTCLVHGNFQQTGWSHLRGSGCPTCGGKTNLTTDTFVERTKSIHGERYDYSKSSYRNLKSKVIITCQIHGDFQQDAGAHLKGSGCPQCAIAVKSQEKFTEHAKAVHKDVYDYPNTKYVTARKKIIIECRKHGGFSQTPTNHLRGSGCPKCAREKGRSTTEQFIISCQNIHRNLYDYSKTLYSTSKEPVIIICSRHGEFRQKAENHLSGSGCPKCRTSRMEREMSKRLEYLQTQKTLDERPWSITSISYDTHLDGGSRQRADFVVTLSTGPCAVIEMDGIQHFQVVSFGNDRLSPEAIFERQKMRDLTKNRWCADNNYHLLRIDYTVKPSQYEDILTTFFNRLNGDAVICEFVGDFYKQQ